MGPGGQLFDMHCRQEPALPQPLPQRAETITPGPAVSGSIVIIRAFEPEHKRAFEAFAVLDLTKVKPASTPVLGLDGQSQAATAEAGNPA
jgi:hypothetical protein